MPTEVRLIYLRKVFVRLMCAILVSSLWTGSCAVLLQAQNPRGTLRGEGQDATGGRIAGAKVAARSQTSSLSGEATSNERGEFRVEGLLPGAYHVTVTAQAFAKASADVDVVVSMVRDLTVTLKLAGAPESVNVEGTASSITTETIDT